MLFSEASNYSPPPLRAQYFLQHPVLKHFHSVSFPPYDTPNFTHLKSTAYIVLFFDKRTEKQKLMNGTEANNPRISSVHNSFVP
jgi:hypothetical protein